MAAGIVGTLIMIAYSALTSLITKNGSECVQLGTFRFFFYGC